MGNTLGQARDKGSKPLHIAAFYLSNESNSASLDQLRIFMERVSQVKGHVWLLADFNLPKFSWDNILRTLKQDCKYFSLYSDFADMLADQNLTQMVTELIRYENVLYLFLTTN